METGDEFSRDTDASGTCAWTCQQEEGWEMEAEMPPGSKWHWLMPQDQMECLFSHLLLQGKGWGRSRGKVNLWWGTPAQGEKMLFFPAPPRNLVPSPQEQQPLSRARGGALLAELMFAQGP